MLRRLPLVEITCANDGLSGRTDMSMVPRVPKSPGRSRKDKNVKRRSVEAKAPTGQVVNPSRKMQGKPIRVAKKARPLTISWAIAHAK